MQFIVVFLIKITILAVFSVLTSGINIGWTSPYLPLLLGPSSPIPTTSSEGSWCAVMPLVGAPVGAFLAATFADVLGRKKTALFTTPIIFISFIGIALARSILVISAFRFVIGATEGALFTVLPMYLAEISEPQIRGFLTSTVALASITGLLLINVLGQTFTIYTSSLICAGVPLIHFATFVWMPESPYYWIKKGKFEKAADSLRTFRGKINVAEELTHLQEAVARQEGTRSRGSLSLLRELSNVSNRRAWLIFAIVNMTSKFSGKNPCLFYTTSIFRETGSTISAELSVIVYCSVELVATVICAAFLVDRFGRRALLITSSLGCAIALLTLGTCFYLKEFYEKMEILNWLPIFCLMAYNMMFSIGLAFGHVTIVSELFPTNVKATALGIADTFSVVMGTIASKFFQITNDEFGMYIPFWSFGIFCVIGLIAIIKIVPETKGKSLEEIQRDLIKAAGKEA